MLPPSHSPSSPSDPTSPRDAQAARSTPNPVPRRAFVGNPRLVLVALASIVFLVLAPNWSMLHHYAPPAQTVEVA